VKGARKLAIAEAVEDGLADVVTNRSPAQSTTASRDGGVGLRQAREWIWLTTKGPSMWPEGRPFAGVEGQVWVTDPRVTLDRGTTVRA
jgi:hypothetical protein